MAERELSPQGYIITKDPVNSNPFWENENYDPNASLPSGGTAGQYLVKNSATNYDAGWKDLPDFVSPDELNAATENFNNELEAETTARENADTQLSQRIDGLDIPNIAPLTQQVQQLSQAVSEETTERENADMALSKRIDELDIPDVGPLTEQVQQLSQSVATVGQSVTDLSRTVGENNDALSQRITTEADDRAQADEALSQQITQESKDRQTQYDAIRQVPEGGAEGQFLTKTADGEAWGDVRQVPEGGTTGQVLTKTETGEEWQDPSGGGSYTLPQATADTLGGVKAKTKSTETVEVAIDTNTGKLYVPDQSGGGGSYVLPQATENALGGIKAKAKTTENGEVVIDTATGKLYVPTQGGSGGGGITRTLIAQWGTISPPPTSGATEITAQTALELQGTTLNAALNAYPFLQVDVFGDITAEGFTSMMLGNPLFGAAQSGNEKYIKWNRPYGTNVISIETNDTTTTYQNTFGFKFLTNSGGVGKAKVSGVAVYGIK